MRPFALLVQPGVVDAGLGWHRPSRESSSLRRPRWILRTARPDNSSGSLGNRAVTLRNTDSDGFVMTVTCPSEWRADKTQRRSLVFVQCHQASQLSKEAAA